MVQTASIQRPRVVLDSFKPLSIFVCPCRNLDPDRVQEFRRSSKQQKNDGDHRDLVDIELPQYDFEEECIGLRARIRPRLLFLSSSAWVALALQAELSPTSGDILSFEQLLAFNSNWRVCQGHLETPDNPVVDGVKLEFQLSSGRSPEQVYRELAIKAMGAYQPLNALRRAVTLSLAEFEDALSDTDLYSFGTIAHSNEIADPGWAAKTTQDQVHDRWREAGIRLFAHSYSLVASCSQGGASGRQDLHWFVPMFHEAYTQLGARIALERVGVAELTSTLGNVETTKQLRECRRHWVDLRRTLGVRWTPEKTQRIQVEQMWRHVSGLQQQSEEVDKRFEQTAELFEAEESGKRNKLIMYFEVIVAGFAVGEVTAEMTRDLGWRHALPWTMGMAALAMVAAGLWLRWRIRWAHRRKKEGPK